MRNFKIIILFVFVSNMNIVAQQEAQYTQYMYNTMIVNPAYTGTNGHTRINAIYRNQWVGLEGAPETQTFSISSPLGKNTGLGLSGINDIIGPSRETTLFGNFAYKLILNRKNLTLSLGLKLGIGFLNIDYDELNIYNTNDSFFQGKTKQTSPKIGIGTYLYSDKWYIGLSAPSMINQKYFSDNTRRIETSKFYLHLIGGYVFDINEKIKLKPTTLIKYIKGTPLSIDVSVNTMIGKTFVLGLSYRLNNSISLLSSIKITNSMTMGYAYDLTSTSLNNSGSHEIFVRYDIPNILKGFVSPRFF
ncbi:MAG: type IX secretion system membrane protein PorP/SprF [Flavobacteriaceae bacterium]|nr:type IX secretion system membrane protein PorP/SprF [Flavobacteriaceae bacterium]